MFEDRLSSSKSLIDKQYLCLYPVSSLILVGGNMLKVNGYNFYQIGMMIHPLAELKDGATMGDYMWLFYQAEQWLNYLDQNNLVPLVVSKQAIGKLYWKLNDVVPANTKEWSKLKFDQKINILDLQNIRQFAKEFETVFAAELQSLNTYFISQHGIYSTSDLIEHAEMTFDEETRKVLSDSVKKDFREAGRCLAFELPTASAFHSMRATEAVLRQWHALVNPTASGKNDWATCVQELKQLGGDKDALGVLDQIRALHRNPVMHPEDFLSLSEAKILFDIATSAITAMAIQITKQSKASTTTS